MRKNCITMAEGKSVSIGLDLGTGGARAVAVDLDGEMIADGRAQLPRDATVVRGVCVEQSPDAWTAAACSALRQLTQRLPSDCEIAGIAVDATSGTFLLADARNRPLTPGIMYNDLRAADETLEAANTLRKSLEPFGIQIAPAFALPKIVHLLRGDPTLARSYRSVIHQTDWIVGRLCGRYDVTDISTALKSGADPARLAWPDALDGLGIAHERLPQIVLPGTEIGQVTSEAASETGLPAGTPVVAGCTDGTAGCLASGAARNGDLNVTLGTTLVFKAIAAKPLIDPDGAIYNHRHPAGGFLPGAASSTGAEWVAEHFIGVNLDELGQNAAGLLPIDEIAYPLVKTGERFPFACANAQGFGLESIEDPVRRFAAGLQGVAFLERLGIARLEQLGLEIGPTVYATGGAVAGETWLHVRASVNRRVYSVPRFPECAVGAAVLAAVPHVGGYAEAANAIVHPGREVEPDHQDAAAYDGLYESFRSALSEQGYASE
jgi:D-ribulokinase